ncbi:unnamed protein product [Lactuca virosa]|uniref:Uncharacterized protein n=1 Tax=Lactuca virosa TaxID=75947 RepID=A0AAU9NEY2_9ASTR|nr:unnamed protein product [Lactuca virosa]
MLTFVMMLVVLWARVCDLDRGMKSDGVVATVSSDPQTMLGSLVNIVVMVSGLDSVVGETTVSCSHGCMGRIELLLTPRHSSHSSTTSISSSANIINFLCDFFRFVTQRMTPILLRHSAGRKFWGCPNYQVEGGNCGLFKLVDEELGQELEMYHIEQIKPLLAKGSAYPSSDEAITPSRINRLSLGTHFKKCLI